MEKFELEIKMSFSLFICILFYSFFFQNIKDNLLLITAISAVFGSKDKIIDSITYAKYRTVGTIIGCIIGCLYLIIDFKFNKITYLPLLLIPLSSFLFTSSYKGSNKNILIRATMMPFLAITLLSTPTKDLSYVKYRVIATLIGLIISIISTLLVDFVIKNAPKNKVS
ncbi:FUSC family protein [Vagococcus fluvialis]|uniref:Integral membrane bound transporter domain-containing protein n=1 Tax=Vagococcus fluvialis TaxID=2738 RepID=A0A7X6D9V2_9ENTE|nr:FUSC family protein [Vagococcus fluvialis]NKC68461.1 hypothetical protein [Vagococcus fluvialis]